MKAPVLHLFTGMKRALRITLMRMNGEPWREKTKS
jgi:hypothetical protein